MDIFATSSNNMTTSNFISFLDFQITGWILTILFVLPENAYVIWLIVTGAGNGVAAEFFSLNLSVCEIVFCLQSVLSLVSRAFRESWFVMRFLTGFSVTGRPLFQSLICVECYLAVVHPVTFLKYKPLRYKVICSAGAWMIILLSCVFATFTVIEFQTHVFTYCLCQALLTLSVKLFCCLAVLRALKKSGPGERKREEENHKKRRAFHIIVMITMAMLLIYASYLFVGLNYVLPHGFILTLWSIGQVCFLLGGLVQPLLYLHRTGKLPFCEAPQSC